MNITKSNLLEKLFQRKGEGLLKASDNLLRDVADAVEKSEFNLDSITNRKLKSEFGLKGGANELAPIIKATKEIIDEENKQSAQEAEAHRENVLPLRLRHAFSELEETLSASIKLLRSATGVAIFDQQARSFAQMTENVVQVSTEYDTRINDVVSDNAALHKSIDEARSINATIKAENKKLTERVQQLENEAERLKTEVIGKEKVEREIERLLGRLEVYESFPKPTVPTPSTSRIKK